MQEDDLRAAPIKAVMAEHKACFIRALAILDRHGLDRGPWQQKASYASHATHRTEDDRTVMRPFGRL